VKGQPRPVVLRVAPVPGRQFRSERELIRNEYATVPWLASLAVLTPRVLAADWTHEVVGRDYLVQTFLDGLPAPEHLGSYPRSSWMGYYRADGDDRGPGARDPWSALRVGDRAGLPELERGGGGVADRYRRRSRGGRSGRR
jgi:hypothetical protein